MPRRYKNHRVSGGRHAGWAWYAHGGGGNGRPLGAMRTAMKSPQTPDCRGGVFAVFAKIPPPTAHPPPRKPSPPVPSTMRGYGRPAHGASRFARRPMPTGHAGDSPSRVSPARYLRGVERGIAVLQTTPPPSATWRAASRLKITAAHSPNIAPRSPITAPRLELPVRYKKEAR